MKRGARNEATFRRGRTGRRGLADVARYDHLQQSDNAMRLPLIVLSTLIVGSTAADADILWDKTPKEAGADLLSWIENDVLPWIASLVDDRITVGDIIIYLVVLAVYMAIMESTFESIGDAINRWRRR